MAIVYFNQGKVTGYKVADLGSTAADPVNDKQFLFDPDTNRPLLDALAHSPERLGVTGDGLGVTLDGAPLPLGADSQTETRRKQFVALVIKARNQPLTNAELTNLLLAVIRRTGNDV